MVNPNFPEWLVSTLRERGWTFSELARRAGISDSSISLVASEQRNPGLDFCVNVAKALGESPEDVLRLAGLLPPISEAVAEEAVACRTFRELSRPARLMALELLRALSITEEEGWEAIAEARAPYRAGRPRSASEWIRQQVDRLLPDLSLGDQQRVLDLAQGLHDGEVDNADVG